MNNAFSGFMVYSVQNSKSILGKQMDKKKVIAIEVMILRLYPAIYDTKHISLCIFPTALKISI